MANILLILSVIGILKTLFMVSLSSKKAYLILYILSAVLFVWLSYPFAIEINKMQVEQVIYSRDSVMDISLVVILDFFLALFFFWVMIMQWGGKKVKAYLRIPACVPSILGYAGLFYIQLNLYFYNTGADFLKTTIFLSLAIIILYSLLMLLFRKNLPEKEFRLEIFLLLGIVTCILGLIKAGQENIVYAAAEEPLNITALLLSAGLFIFAFTLGYLWNKRKWVILQKRTLKKKTLKTTN